MNLDDSTVVRMAVDQLTIEAEAVNDAARYIGEPFVRAVRRLSQRTGHVLVTGAGTSHAVALRLAHLLSCSGTPALFLDAGDAQHGLAGAIQAADVVVAISKGGRTAEVNHVANVARRRGASVVALVDDSSSPLAAIAEIQLAISSPAAVDLQGVVATGSSLVHAAYGDALCAVLMVLNDYRIEQFAQTHPGGAIGASLANRAEGGR